MDMNTIKVALMAMVVSLIAGRFLRKIVLILLDRIAKSTDTKLDDELVETAKHDLGVTDTTIDGKDEDK